ncbi:MAG: hypothetical protein RR190_05320, partial [Bacteroidales bacterium]
YQFDFSAYSIDKNVFNSLEVLVAYNVDTISKVITLINTDSVDDMRFRNQKIQFVASCDSAYYLVFRVKSKAKTSALNIEKIKIKEVFPTDLSITKIDSPLAQKIEYTSEEPFLIEITNTGSRSILNRSIQISAYVNAEKDIQENYTLSLQANESKIIRLAGKLNLKNLHAQNGVFPLSVTVSMDGDMDKTNDTLCQSMVELLVIPPYFPNLGNAIFPTHEENYWTSVDKNQDGKIWDAYSDDHALVFAYGTEYNPIATTSDLLCSRPLFLDSNIGYKIQFYTRVNKGEFSLQLGIYQKIGDTLQKVDSLSTEQIRSITYKRCLAEFKPKKKGIFYIGFSLENNSSISNRIMIDQFSICKGLNSDFSLTKILSPGNKISHLDSLPFGCVVFNNGKNKIENIDIYYQINEEIPTKQSFDLSFESNQEKFVYFSDLISFVGITPYKFSIWGTWAEDENKKNDTLTMDFQSLVADTSVYYSADGASEGWVVLDQNRDANSWEKKGIGFQYVPINGKGANDYLLSRHFTLQADTLYAFAISTQNMASSKPANLRIALGQGNHPQTHTSLLADLYQFERTPNYYFPDLMYYIRVPKDGDYVISMQAYDSTAAIEINNIRFNKQNPQHLAIDLAVTEVLEPKGAKVFGKKEKVKVEVKNNGILSAQGANIYLQVGEKIYTSYLDPSPEFLSNTKISFAFSDIDLSEVKKHVITIFTNQTQDINRLNDTLKFTIESLPIHNIRLMNIVDPSSGELTNAENIRVLIKNEGKGPIHFVPLQLLINNEIMAYDTLKQDLNQGDSLVFTFAQKFNFLAAKT